MLRSVLLGSTMIAIAGTLASPAAAQGSRLRDAPQPTTALTREQIDNLSNRRDAIDALRNLPPQPWQDRNPPHISLRGIADNGLEYGFRLRDDGPTPTDIETISVLQNAQGPFVSIDVGASVAISTRVRSENFGGDTRTDLGTSFMLQLQGGLIVYPGISAAFGWQHRPGFGLNYTFGGERIRADATSDAFMANFRVMPLVAFPQIAGNRGVLSPIQPTFEFGLGAAINRLEGTNVTDAASGAPLGSVSGRSSTHFAWTIGGGANFDLGRLTGINGLTGAVGYRYVDLGSLHGGNQFTSSGGSTSTIDPIQTDLRGHDFYLRFTYRFGAPPASPPPAP